MDCGTVLRFARDRVGDVAHLPDDPHAKLLWVIGPAIALVDMDAAGLDPSQLFRLGDNWPEGVIVDRFRWGALAWITNWLLFERRAAG